MTLREKIPIRTFLLLFGVIAVVITTFLLFGDRVESMTQIAMARSRQAPWQTGLLVVFLLVIDVVVPIPSSIVCTAAGIFMGIAAGTLAAWIGLTGTVVASYLIGRYATKPAEIIIGTKEFELLQRFHQRHGLWLLIAMRPVPILSEASVLFAGISRLPLVPVLLATGLANIIVAALYVALGAWGRETDAFMPAFGLSIALSAVFMGIARWRSKSNQTVEKG
jgi:uncharacterized membrane protein YdjX (TVP38/TMEM64 family)